MKREIGILSTLLSLASLLATSVRGKAQQSSLENFRHITCMHQVWCGSFDVILVIGQSNATSRGMARRPILDAPNDRIYQLGRNVLDYQVVNAFEPLMHVTYGTMGIGFALPFARLYRDEFLRPKRSVLIIPAANGGSAVVGREAYWRPGGPGYQDVRGRLAAALHSYRDARLAAILWHQGESDWAVDQEGYKRLTTELLTSLRDEFDPGHKVPLILGELPVAYRKKVGSEAVNDSIHALADALPNAGLALSHGLVTRGEIPEAKDPDMSHFSAGSQLELAKRYFCAYVRLAHPGNRIANLPYSLKHTRVKNPPLGLLSKVRRRIGL